MAKSSEKRNFDKTTVKSVVKQKNIQPVAAEPVGSSISEIEMALQALMRPQVEKLQKHLDVHAKALGCSTPELRSAYLDCIGSFGEIAESKLQAEFGKWLIKFVGVLAESEARMDAWQKLKNAGHTLLLLGNLYLFTYLGDTTANALQHNWGILKDALDKLIADHEKLCKETSAVIDDPRLRVFMLSFRDQGLTSEPSQHLKLAQRKLEMLRTLALKMSSGKTDSHNMHLYSLATMVHTATGSGCTKELANLIESAYAAHGARGEIFSRGHTDKAVTAISGTHESTPAPRTSTCQEEGYLEGGSRFICCGKLGSRNVRA